MFFAPLSPPGMIIASGKSDFAFEQRQSVREKSHSILILCPPEIPPEPLQV